MLVSVIETDLYLSRARKLMSEDERDRVIDIVAATPLEGDLIPGSGGLRKLRIPLEGRGKRGGGRVIYWFQAARTPAVLLFVFAKNEASDLTPDQSRMLASSVAELAKDYG
jgi:RelE toxin of RelE / RelB toxin-antitoxin system